MDKIPIRFARVEAVLNGLIELSKRTVGISDLPVWKVQRNKSIANHLRQDQHESDIEYRASPNTAMRGPKACPTGT